MLYGYCIRRSTDPPPPDGTAGVEEAPVLLLEDGDLGIWLSDAPADRNPAAAKIRAHDAVVRAAMSSATPLPIRFGTVFADEHAAQAVLRDRATAFTEALDRVRGKMEMGVRIVWDEEAQRGGVLPPDEPRPRISKQFPGGRHYLEGRRRRIDAERALKECAEELLDGIEAAFAPLAAPCVREIMPRTDVAGTLAHLVDRSERDGYRLRVEGVRRGFTQVSIAMSGPFAPYSFVE